MFSSRRGFLKSLSRSALVLSLESLLGLIPEARNSSAAAQKAEKLAEPLGTRFIDVGRAAGLNAVTLYGGVHKNKYLLETTGCGAAFYDYDNDGWLDIFLVNGWRLEGFPLGQEPTSHLFKNNRDGTFTDVTAQVGLKSPFDPECMEHIVKGVSKLLKNLKTRADDKEACTCNE